LIALSCYKFCAFRVSVLNLSLGDERITIEDASD